MEIAQHFPKNKLEGEAKICNGSKQLKKQRRMYDVTLLECDAYSYTVVKTGSMQASDLNLKICLSLILSVYVFLIVLLSI